MKVIDLINMMNNKEDLPEKIKINKRVFHSNFFRSMIYEEDCNTDIWMAIKLQHIDLDDVVKIIEENQDIDIQSIEHNELDILQEILGKCDLWKGNEDYILKVINENNNRLVDAILKVSKENETIINAIKQLDRQIKEDK